MVEARLGRPHLLGSTLVGMMDSVTEPTKEYMADYPIRRSFCFARCVLNHISAISNPSEPMPPLGSSSTICYLRLMLTLWPKGGLLVHTSY